MLNSKERIQRLAAEAEAGRAEKAEKAEKAKKTEKKKAAPRKKASDAVARQKIVWKVFDAGFKEVACFPYPEKAEAYLAVETLTKKKNKFHFVNEATVPMIVPETPVS